MSYERVPMETMEIEGTPSESPAPEGGDEEGGLEEATAETLAKENLPLENLDEFSVPTYSPQELMNRKDFSEMGVEESRAVARAILLIATKIATQISRRKKIGRKGNTVDPRWTMRRSMKYGGEVVELVHRKRRNLAAVFHAAAHRPAPIDPIAPAAHPRWTMRRRTEHGGRR